VTSKKKRSNEFRRHRQVLTALYLIAAAAGFLLLTASVVKQIFFRKSTVELSNFSVVADNPGPRDLLECHDLVLEQFIHLSTKTSELFARPLRGGGADGATDAQALGRSPSERQAAWRADWKNYSTQWRDQWDLIDARCRFTELAETNLGAAYDQMAQVHEALPAMRLKYNRLIADFDKEQADELRQMRQMLSDSRNTFTSQLQPALGAPAHEMSGSEEALP
jgi:hypothetical protein